jgi:hypothetical protein
MISTGIIARYQAPAVRAMMIADRARTIVAKLAISAAYRGEDERFPIAMVVSLDPGAGRVQ